MLKIGNAKIAETVRFHVAESALCEIADGVELRDHVVIECGDHGYLHIGENSTVNYGTWINASGRVVIGKNVLIAPNASITSSSHRYATERPISLQGMEYGEVQISDDVWIGASASILIGANIGSGSIVAANSTVKSTYPASTILAGSPARAVSSRKNMVVAFYTLPFVIRNLPTLFSSIIDVYLPLANNFKLMGWRCIFIGTNELAKEYPHLEWFTPENHSADYSAFSGERWKPEWLNVLQGNPSPEHESFLDTLLSSLNPALLFCWNFDAHLKSACAKHEVAVLFNELGLLRPPNPMMYYSDPCGVNVSAGLSCEFESDLAKLGDAEAGYRLTMLDSVRENYRSSQERMPYLLVLLQVSDDSNVLLGSPFATMYDFIHCVSQATTGYEIPILLKPHPLDELPLLPNDIEVADKNASTTDLIANASAVFTINSSAGFEAALAGKPVYVLGKAPYSGLGITYDIASPESLSEIWHTHGCSPAGTDLRCAQIYDFCTNRYFANESNWADPSFHFSRLVNAAQRSDRKRNKWVDFEVALQQRQIAFLEDKCLELRTEVSSVGQIYEKQQGWISHLEEDNSKLGENNSKLEEDNSNLKIELQIKQKLALDLQSTISWRITRPLRFIRSFPSRAKANLRPLYQRRLWIARAYQIVKSLLGIVKRSIWTLASSDANNLKAIGTLSLKRRDHALSQVLTSEVVNIDVSVVTYNSSRWIERFFETLLNQRYPLSAINLIFVDNSSTDNTREVLNSLIDQHGHRFASAILIRKPNLGFGAGHDAAITFGQSPFVLVTNIDLEFEQDSLTELLAAVRVSGQEDVASWELRQMPYEHPKYYDPVTLETNWSSHACVLIRREAYQKVGGYEPKIFMYAEDVELSYRFRSFGYRLKYCPMAVVKHYSYEKAGEVKPLQFSGSTLGNAYVRLRYGNWKDRFAIIPLYCGLLAWPAPYSGAKKDVVRNIGLIIRNAFSMMHGKGKSTAYFPFRLFDYEMIREGAFLSLVRCIDGPLVSIIIRTYQGRDRFLREALQSALNQTYRHLEILVVEDGGDQMRAIAENYQNQVCSVRYVSCSKVGRSVTGNTGLSEAKGEYVMFLDDDDLLFPDHIEILMSELKNNSKLDAAYSLAVQVYTNRDGDDYQEIRFEDVSTFRQEWDYSVLQDHNFMPIQSVLFHRRLYEQWGGFEVDMDQLEDWNLWLRYGHGATFKYVAKTTSLFRVPANDKVRLERHLALHEAYEIARSRACYAISNLNLRPS